MKTKSEKFRYKLTANSDSDLTAKISESQERGFTQVRQGVEDVSDNTYMATMLSGRGRRKLAEYGGNPVRHWAIMEKESDCR